MDVEAIKRLIRLHEGLRLKPYVDTTGHASIGYGRNLTDVGINIAEAELMLKTDVVKAIAGAQSLFADFDGLSEARKAVLVDMCFNLGREGLSRFRRLRAAVDAQQWGQATISMMRSKWHRQVGNRALRLERMMLTGEWLDL